MLAIIKCNHSCFGSSPWSCSICCCISDPPGSKMARAGSKSVFDISTPASGFVKQSDEAILPFIFLFSNFILSCQYLINVFCRNFSNLHRRWQRCGAAIYIINSFHEARPWLLVCIPSLVTGTWCGIWGGKASAIIGYAAYEDWWYQLMLSTKSFGVIIWRNMCDKGEKNCQLLTLGPLLHK